MLHTYQIGIITFICWIGTESFQANIIEQVDGKTEILI